MICSAQFLKPADAVGEDGSVYSVRKCHDKKVAPQSLKNLPEKRNWAFIKDGAKEADTELILNCFILLPLS